MMYSTPGVRRMVTRESLFALVCRRSALLERLPPDGNSGDKFLVQTVAVNRSFFSKVSSLNSVQQAEEVGDEQQRVVDQHTRLSLCRDIFRFAISGAATHVL